MSEAQSRPETRVNQENTDIKIDLYPLAGLDPVAVESRFADILAPYENDIMQLESALLLYNIPLFGALAGFIVGFLVLSLILTRSFLSPLTYAVIAIPILQVVYLLGVKFVRTLYTASLPNLPEDDLARVRSLKELLHWFAPTIKWAWRIVFFVYRTFVCPNLVDSTALVLFAIIIGSFAKQINPLGVLLFLTVVALAAPTVLTKSPPAAFIKQLMEGKQRSRNNEGETVVGRLIRRGGGNM
jgi:hypothetical protein